eukprot:4135294-Pyramimonas_sp.AAC.1
MGIRLHQLAVVWLAHWSRPVSRQAVGLTPKVILDLRGGGLDSVGLHLVLAAALEGHDVAWIAEHPVKEGKGL